MSLCLTAVELEELTGCKYSSRQIEWLRSNGFQFRVAATGAPRVDRSHYLKMMGGTSEAPRQKTAPDYSAMLPKAA